MLIMIMRATQKKIISKPVTKTLEGRYFCRSAVVSGQPMVVNGTSAEENQVSSTSSSRVSGPSMPWARARSMASVSLRATMISPDSLYQDGILWQHLICLELHKYCVSFSQVV